MESGRNLIKGPLRPPDKRTKATSYTQAPTSKNEISVRNKKEKGIQGQTEDCETPVNSFCSIRSSTYLVPSRRVLLSSSPTAIPRPIHHSTTTSSREAVEDRPREKDQAGGIVIIIIIIACRRLMAETSTRSKLSSSSRGLRCAQW